AALRDRTTGLLALLTPGPRLQPAWATLEARATATRARSRRRFRYGGWAASVAAAVALGWLARDFAPEAAGNGAAGEPAAAVTPALASAEPSTSVVPTRDSTPVSSAAPRPEARLASAEPAPPRPAGADTAVAEAAPVAAGMELRAAEGVLSDFPLAGVWRTISWDRVQRDSSGWVPRVDGLPVKEVRVSQRTSGGLSVVSQQLASGQTIRTVAGPASDVRSLVSNRPGQSASAQLQVDPSMASKADGERLLVILGDIPADSLRAMLLRVK
ncbi:MAG TPA: hypothetical protein VLA95_12015, partial [Gemmatimonadales bacterium]|nr:hypothetical protein [Gemmatimonadales bacterium]